MTEFLEAALKYAELGWRVLPCRPKQKIPATPHGVKDATTNLEQIKAWWAQNPQFNVAIACGKESGVYVVDVDVTEAGDVNGYDSLEEFDELPETVRQDTPRGGFHAFYRTDDPPKNKNSFRPGIDIRGDGYYVVACPSIHPNGGRYVWAPDQGPGQIEIAEFPDFMRPAEKAPWVAPPISQSPRLDPTGVRDDVKMQIAEAYIQHCEPAFQGQGGHDKLFWAAQCMVNGIGLSDSQAFDILSRQYNPFCTPPWNLQEKKDYRDFVRKITEARKHPPSDLPYLWILNDPEYAHLRGEVPQEVRDGAAEMLAAHRESQQQILAGRSVFPARLVTPLEDINQNDLMRPPGLVGEICDWINSTALCRQPFLTLGCALAFCGSLFGRKVTEKTGARTNLYCMGVGDSSSGKNWPPGQIRKLCLQAGALDLLGGETVASDAGIEERIHRFPATLFLWDEIGFLLRSLKANRDTHKTGVVPLLMRLYSSSGSTFTGREYADAEKQRRIIQPCCCIYGSSTPDRFLEGISESELSDGWLSRCLVFRVEDNQPPKSRDRCNDPPPKEVCELVSKWFRRRIKPKNEDLDSYAVVHGGANSATLQPPTQLFVPSTDEAERLLISLDNTAREIGAKDKRSKYLWLKAEENARKVALIIAAGLNYEHPEITWQVAEYACNLISLLIWQFMHTIAPEMVVCSVDAEKRKIARIVEEHGINGCRQREITRRTQHLNQKARNGYIADMLDADILVSEPGPKRKHGRPPTIYWTAGNYVAYLEGQKNG